MNKGRTVKKRVSAERVAAMYRDHIEGGMTIVQVGHKYGRAAASVSQIFNNRGLPWNRSGRHGPARDPHIGSFVPLPPFGPDQLDEAIAQMTKPIAHCTPEMKQFWTEALAEEGITV